MTVTQAKSVPTPAAEQDESLPIQNAVLKDIAKGLDAETRKGLEKMFPGELRGEDGEITPADCRDVKENGTFAVRNVGEFRGKGYYLGSSKHGRWSVVTDSQNVQVLVFV